MRLFYLGILVLVSILQPLSVNAITGIDNRALIYDSIYYNDGDIACSDIGGTPGNTEGVDRFLQVLAHQESTGDPKAQAAGSSASGKYQYIDGTWASSTNTYYKPGSQYAHAKDAPEEVQDAVAYLEYTKKFKDYKGDLFKLAISHFLPAANTNPALLDIIHGNNVLTPSQYADKFLESIKKGDASNIELKYQAAPDFEIWLAKVGGSSGGSTGTASGNCIAHGVPAGDFVFYSQSDPKWHDYPFGSSTLAPSGCGPTSLAMVVATLKDKTITPVQTADYGTQNNGYQEGAGSVHQVMFIDGPKHWGLKSSPIGTDMNKAVTAIENGALVIASGNGPVPFTTGGHIIVLRGVTEDGKILVGDPAHPQANEVEYDRNELLGSIKAMWAITK